MRTSIIAAAMLLVALPAFAQSAQRRLAVTATNVTNAEQTLIRAYPARTIHMCVLVGGAANESVVFRAVDDSPVYATVGVNAGETKVVSVVTPITEEGLEIGTTNPAGDVTVTCVYSVTTP